MRLVLFLLMILISHIPAQAFKFTYVNNSLPNEWITESGVILADLKIEFNFVDATGRKQYTAIVSAALGGQASNIINITHLKELYGNLDLKIGYHYTRIKQGYEDKHIRIHSRTLDNIENDLEIVASLPIVEIHGEELFFKKQATIYQTLDSESGHNIRAICAPAA